ncbi:MAG: glycosyltransferase family 4 protein [Chlorobiaceae bacterium]|nr:glycosyltransferase family 4 protein [Chlorobiaceae bacterium]
MHVLVVSQYFWPENFRINDLVRSLTDRGHQVTVLTGIPNYPEGRFFTGYGLWRNVRQKYFGAEVVRVPLFPRGKGDGISLLLNYFSFAFFSSILSPFLIKGTFDLIFVCQLSPVTVGLPAILLKKLLKAPIVFWILDLWPESLSASGAVSDKRILAFMDKVVRFIYRNSDKIVVSSRGFIDSVKAKGVSSDRLEYFPNWYEPEYDSQQPAKSADYVEKIILPNGFRLMFAGNIGASQDFEIILSAAEILKKNTDIHWVILGDGRRFEWLKEQVYSRDLSTCIHLLGRYPPQAMPGFFASADAMLVTLTRNPVFSLTIPGKIQSYMACGKPIIAALDGEGYRLIVDSGAGLASPSEDTFALVESVLTIYKMPKEKRIEMGESGRMYCEANFNREILMDRFEGWLDEIA